MSEPYRRITAPLDSSQIQKLEQLSDQEFWTYARTLAAASPADEVQTDLFLECALSQGSALLPLAQLREILPPPHRITLFPATPAWMPGVTGWRGETIPVVDLNAYMLQRPALVQSEQMLLIVEQDDLRLGLLAVTYGALPALEARLIAPPETMRSQYPRVCAGAITGVYINTILLNLQVIITDMVQHIQDDGNV